MRNQGSPRDFTARQALHVSFLAMPVLLAPRKRSAKSVWGGDKFFPSYFLAGFLPSDRVGVIRVFGTTGMVLYQLQTGFILREYSVLTVVMH